VEGVSWPCVLFARGVRTRVHRAWPPVILALFAYIEAIGPIEYAQSVFENQNTVTHTRAGPAWSDDWFVCVRAHALVALCA
jgi:hypothetical protein